VDDLLHATTAEAECVCIDAPSADTGAEESTTLADSIWDKTDTGSRAARNTRTRIVALGIATLGSAGAWFAQRTSKPPIVAPTPMGEPTETPTERADPCGERTEGNRASAEGRGQHQGAGHTERAVRGSVYPTGAEHQAEA